MVSKITKVSWPEGTFIETVKLWQQEWFYLADAPSGNQEDVPAFSAEPPKRLRSWTDKGLNWGDQKEVEALQRKVKAVVDTGVKLVDVVHMMLHRRILPLQARAAPMWRYKPDDEVVIRRFFRGADLGGMWKLLFKPTGKGNKFPSRAEDIGLSRANPTPEVTFICNLLVNLSAILFLTEWSALCDLYRLGVRVLRPSGPRHRYQRIPGAPSLKGS